MSDLFRSILLPVDLGARAEATVDVARRLATMHKSTITLLHVIETLDAPFEELQEFYHGIESIAHGRLAALAAELSADGLTVKQQICFGKRAREIVRIAEEEDFDLILLGSHRLVAETLPSGLMTVSHQVAIAASVPVLIVKFPT